MIIYVSSDDLTEHSTTMFICVIFKLVSASRPPVPVTSYILRLVGLLGRYIRKYPSLAPTSKSLHTLFNAILDKLKAAIEHDVFIPIFPKQMLENKSPFFQRQFASGLKLLRNVTSWQRNIND